MLWMKIYFYLNAVLNYCTNCCIIDNSAAIRFLFKFLSLWFISVVFNHIFKTVMFVFVMVVDICINKQSSYYFFSLLLCVVSHTTASTSSSSDTGMSPSSASPTQNTVAVECRWWHASGGPSYPAWTPPPLPQISALSAMRCLPPAVTPNAGPEPAANSTRLPRLPLFHHHLATPTSCTL